MLPYLQLFLAGLAIYSALQFQEGMNLYVPLACLISMLAVSRIDRNKSEEKKARKSFLKAELEKIAKIDGIPGRDQDFFTIESLLWPKSELLLIDAVHAIFMDLGFRISAGISYRSVDRIVRIPETEKSFGLEIMLSENEADRTHPKVLRAMQFEKEKKGKEKTLIIASTNTNLPLTERAPVTHISKELADLLIRHGMSFMTARQLYELWQKAKGGQIDVFEAFEKVYSRPGGPLPFAWF
jgi:hypothetical protein